MAKTVDAFGTQIAEGNEVVYATYARGEKRLRRMQVTEVSGKQVRGFLLDDPLRRMVNQGTPNWRMVVNVSTGS